MTYTAWGPDEIPAPPSDTVVVLRHRAPPLTLLQRLRRWLKEHGL